MSDFVIHTGGCHCGAVTFEVLAPEDLEVCSCNCSICAATGFVHLLVESDQFRLITGEDELTEYTFNTKTAKHYFCKKCGIKSFYIPRSHPNGFSVNLNCLDRSNIKSVNAIEFDGQNWERNIHTIT